MPTSRAAVLSFALLLLAACSEEPGSGPVQQEAKAPPPVALGTERAEDQVLRRGNGAEPQTLDPHKAEGVPSSRILRDLFEGLVSEAPNGDLIPGGAESWTVSDDGLVYTFKIRKNARWSNGDPVTAKDFEFGLQRSVDPNTGSKYSQILAPIVNAEAIIANEKPASELGVKALDDYTLTITLNAPTPYLIGLLTHSTTYPVHRRSAQEYGDQFSRPGKLVGNGAYQLAEWVVQSHIKVVRNPNYWDNDKTVIDEVYYYPIENQSTELKRYRAGELDWTETLPLNQFRWIQKNLKSELHVPPYLGTYYYGFNLRRPPFKDNLKLRKALTLAVDRETLTEKVTQFGEIPAYGWVPPGIQGYHSYVPDYAKLTQQERTAEAKRLYQEAGYSETNPLKVELRYNTHENHKKIAIAIASMWKTALGVQTTLFNEEWKVFLENRKQKQVTQAFRAGWIGDYNDPNTFSELMHSNHGLNDSDYKNPEYDAMLAQAAAESDPGKRMQILEKAEEVLIGDAPIMPLYFYVTKRLLKPWVAGYEDNVMDHHYSKHLYILKHQ
ncbi:MAG: peptide ABC transporter substrate-binding protein [Gammaproteobacteria bacterium]|nr:peptide ABC transporter substrate-binding protein [Gammaproteobacteria bacterium]